MRLNYWIGSAYTMHLPREILEKNTKNINTPILPILGELKLKWIYDLIDEKKSVLPEKIFYTTDKDEGNVGTYNLKLDDSDFFFKYCVPHTPSGSRFWFYKLKTIDLFLEDYEETLKNFINYDWIEIRKKENPKLANLSRKKIAELSFERLDQMADRYGADEWKPFTPHDYFNNGDQSETPLLFRLYTKS